MEENTKKNKQIFGVEITTLLIICYIGAFLGFLVENLFRLIRIGVFDDRHQLLPFLCAYGIGVFVLFVVFGTPTNMRFFKHKILPKDTKINKALRVLLYFVTLFVVILVGEMSVGLLFEKTLGIKAWNYLNIPLHITRYTSIPTTTAFTLGIIILMECVFPVEVKTINKINSKIRFYIALILGVLILIDYFVLIITGITTGSFPNYWSISIK